LVWSLQRLTNVVNGPHAENALIFHQAKMREVENGADGAMFQLHIKMEPTEKDALIREMPHIPAMIFSIHTNAKRVGLVPTKPPEHAPKTLKEEVMDPKTDAKNIANHFHQNQSHINATSLPTHAMSATNNTQTQLAKKTERKLATTAMLHQLLSSDATEPTKRTHHARDATKETKDVETKSRSAKTAHHQPNS